VEGLIVMVGCSENDGANEGATVRVGKSDGLWVEEGSGDGMLDSNPVGGSDSIPVGDAVIVGASVGNPVSGDEVNSIVGVLVLFSGTNVVDMSFPCKDRTHAIKVTSS
jgi:hypothetical protein